MHRMVELEIAGELDEASLPEWLRPKLAGFRKFVVDTGFMALASEHQMYSQSLGVAGTLDMLGPFRTERLAIVDLKRSLYGGRVIGLQTAGYKRLWDEESDMKVDDRYALVLGDGDYKLTKYDDPRDEAVFLAMVTIHKWRQA